MKFSQASVWNNEYKNPKLMTGGDNPQADVLRFLKFLKKVASSATRREGGNQNFILAGKNVLDLGCGTGRNSKHLATLGCDVVGIEISRQALNIAIKNAQDKGIKVDYRLGDIGSPYDLKDESIDIVLDVTSSNSLDEKGRENYLNEMNRVLKDDGYIFVRALCKDGNKNVKNLLKDSPGREYDTYTLKEIGLTERVFSRVDFIKMYSKYFKILNLEKKTGYTRLNNRVYKRDYFISYLTKE
jgi:SAM-dependent methyltransferase